jgi:hypothetical protein
VASRCRGTSHRRGFDPRSRGLVSTTPRTPWTRPLAVERHRVVAPPSSFSCQYRYYSHRAACRLQRRVSQLARHFIPW